MIPQFLYDTYQLLINSILEKSEEEKSAPSNPLRYLLRNHTETTYGQAVVLS